VENNTKHNNLQSNHCKLIEKIKNPNHNLILENQNENKPLIKQKENIINANNY
jgi:hypothetical protein